MSAIFAWVFSYLSTVNPMALELGGEVARRRPRVGGSRIGIGACCCAVVVIIAAVIILIVVRRRRPKQQ